MTHTRLDRDSISTKWIQRTLLLGVVLLAFLFLVGPASAGAKDNEQRATSSEAEAEAALKVPKDPVDTVTVTKKTPQRLVTFDGRSYRLDKGTIIVGQDGKQVGLRNLRLPCDAKITYTWVKGARKAKRVKVIETDSEAKAIMSYDKPR